MDNDQPTLEGGDPTGANDAKKVVLQHLVSGLKQPAGSHKESIQNVQNATAALQQFSKLHDQVAKPNKLQQKLKKMQPKSPTQPIQSAGQFVQSQMKPTSQGGQLQPQPTQPAQNQNSMYHGGAPLPTSIPNPSMGQSTPTPGASATLQPGDQYQQNGFGWAMRPSQLPGQQPQPPQQFPGSSLENSGR